MSSWNHIVIVLFAGLTGLGQEVFGQTGQVVGTVHQNVGTPCQFNPNATTFSMWPVSLSNGNEVYHTLSRTDGTYEFSVPPGTYDIWVTPLSDSIFGMESCSFLSGIQVVGNEVDTVNIPVETYMICEEMMVDAVFKEIENDTTVPIHLSCMNIGSKVTPTTQIILDLDSTISFDQASEQWEVDTPSGMVVLTFNGVQAGETTFINAKGFLNAVGMDSLLESQLHAPRGYDCDGPVTWDGSTIVVEGYCNDNDSVIFRITNVGTGNMAAPGDYIILEDDLLVYDQNQFNLSSGSSVEIGIQGNESYYRLIAQQSPEHPSLGNPVELVSPCLPIGQDLGASAYSLGGGYLNHRFAPSNQHEIAQLQEGLQLQVYPKGICENNEVLISNRLEFTLRVENEFEIDSLTVHLRFPIPEFLNPESFRPGASTHEYSIEMNNGNLDWSFPNLFLSSDAQSSDNELAVKFSFKPYPNTQVGESIASSFLAGLSNGTTDISLFSEVITQTLVDSFSCLIIGDVPNSPNPIMFFPNPADQIVRFSNISQVHRAQIIGLDGRLILEKDNTTKLDVSGIGSGVYILRLETSGGILQRKLMIQH